ncbi:MAG: class I SAM-dependent methyltransferase [Candidatus Zipacnadales bacterium]
MLEILADARQAPRRGALDQAREKFAEALSLARTQGDEVRADLAAAHLALLSNDRESAEVLLVRLAKAIPHAPETAAVAMLVAKRWPPPPRACETHLCASVKRFRELCAALPRPEETVLELGAAQGLATRVLARVSNKVYAVEKSSAMAEKARAATARYPHVTIIVANADDLGIVRAHVPQADVICLDIGGSTPFPKVVHRAREYRELYQPRVLVMRSVYLNNFVAQLTSVESIAGSSLWPISNST